MNGNCIELATHATNYLCESCFHHQQEVEKVLYSHTHKHYKQVMASFSGPSHRRTPSSGHANWSLTHSKSSSYGGHMQEGVTVTVVSGGQQRHYNTLNNGGTLQCIGCVVSETNTLQELHVTTQYRQRLRALSVVQHFVPTTAMAARVYARSVQREDNHGT